MEEKFSLGTEYLKPSSLIMFEDVHVNTITIDIHKIRHKRRQLKSHTSDDRAMRGCRKTTKEIPS